MSIAGPLISAVGSLFGGLLGKSSQEKANEQNIKLQKQFAQEGIQWKVADAVKAGVHPLYALGAQTTAFSPSVVGDTALPNALQNMGQDIGRAVGARMTPEGKAAATIAALQVERAGLENDLLRSQIRAINAPGSPPGVPVIGQDASDPLIMGGKEITRNPNFSDAQDFENRYGEWTDWTVGPFIGAGDLFATLPKGTAGSQKPTGNWLSDWFYGRQ